MFLWTTAEDEYRAPEHSHRLAAALAAPGCPHALHVFTRGPHSLGLAVGCGTGTAVDLTRGQWIAEVTSSHIRRRNDR